MHGHFHLGRLHNSGLCGLSIDTAQAAHHYALAAMQGHAPALVNLGVLYHTGSSIGGIAKNVEKAVELYRRAATQGVPKQYKRAWYNLGVCYETGCGVELDLERARECYEKSAGEGGKFLQGVCSLGMCYQYGVGGEVDLEKAVRLYRRAARKGCARAAFYLGLCYENGHGVEESDGRAERLFRHARDLGLEQAASYLQRFQQRMNALEKSTSTDRKNGAGGDTGVGVREEEAGRRRRSDAAGMSTSVTFNEQRRQRDYVGGNARKVECGHIGRARIGLSGVHDARRHVRTSTEQSDGVDAKSTRRRRMESDWKQTQKQEQKQQEVEKRNTGTEERGTEWVCMAQVQEGSETDFDTDVDSLYSLGGESSEAGSMSSSWTWSRRGSTASGRL